LNSEPTELHFVRGDLESAQGSEGTSGGTPSKRILGTSQTAPPLAQVTWRVHRAQRVQVVVIRADKYQKLFGQHSLPHRRPGKYKGQRVRCGIRQDTRPTFHYFQTMASSQGFGRAEARVSLSPDAKQ
jgi:hypothetical protein